MSALAFLAAHWRDVVVGAAILTLVAMCHSRDVAIADRARAEVAYQRADSTVRAIRPQLARVDTQLVHDTVTVQRVVARVTTLRDTVLKHLTDTVLMREFVTRSDSAAHACTELANTCEQFRAFAFQRFAADSIKIVTAPRIQAAASGPGFKSGVVVGISADILARILIHNLSR